MTWVLKQIGYQQVFSIIFNSSTTHRSGFSSMHIMCVPMYFFLNLKTEFKSAVLELWNLILCPAALLKSKFNLKLITFKS